MHELTRSIRLLGPEDYRRMPWKNRMGMTTQIAVSPSDATLEGEPFRWRVSLAEVNASGDFSLFPDYDRSITLTGGAGMQLSFDSAPPHCITQRYQPFRFQGRWQTHCRLLDGPVRDFNVISARSQVTHACEIATSSCQISWQAHSETVLLYCFEGRLILKGLQRRPIKLDACHTVLLESSAGSQENTALDVSAAGTDAVAVIVKISDL